MLYFIEEKLIQEIVDLKKREGLAAVGVRFFYSLLKFGDRVGILRINKDSKASEQLLTEKSAKKIKDISFYSIDG